MDCCCLLRMLRRTYPQQMQWPKLELSRQRCSPFNTGTPPTRYVLKSRHITPCGSRWKRWADWCSLNQCQSQIHNKCNKVDRKIMRELLENTVLQEKHLKRQKYTARIVFEKHEQWSWLYFLTLRVMKWQKHTQWDTSSLGDDLA